jgi:hypothetical protein
MLSIETDIPVALLPVDSAEIDFAAALQFLRSLNLLALGARADNGDAQNAESGHELARLEAKIDMLVAMVGSLVAKESNLPPLCRVSLSVESLQVNLAAGVAPGDAVIVDLYPSAELPRALRLPATVAGAHPADGGRQHVSLKFGPLDPAVSDELERYIFLRHRHALSSARS